MKEFVHLHTHTEFSLLDGAARIDDLVDTAIKMGHPAIAITDHGNMYGASKFYDKVKAYNEKVEDHNELPENADNLMKPLKAIIGCEFYCVDDRSKKPPKEKRHHLVLIAKNQQGYKNLIQLNSISFTEGFYYKPRIDYKDLEKHSEGIICLSACLAGVIPRLIMAGRMDEAEEKAMWFKNLYGEDFYLELQNHLLEEDKLVMEKTREIAKKLDIKLVATNDIHYVTKEDAETQDILMCIQMQRDYDDPTRMKFQGEEFYYKNYEEMKEVMGGDELCLDMSIEIANKCEIVKIERKNLIPGFAPPEGLTPKQYLRNLIEEGLKKRYKEETEEIRARAEKEFGLIVSMGFVEYFLIVWDFINYARQIGVSVGLGRGSGAGSIVAYAIGITGLDPLKYNLLFERFINPERVSMPDFDIDFADDRREEVIEYVHKKYGYDKVSHIATFGTMAAKAAVKDVARVLRMPFADVNKITKNMDTSGIKGKRKLPILFGLTGNAELDRMANVELNQMYYEDPTVKKVIDLAIKLEGLPRNCSLHAAGIVICDYPLADHVPMHVTNGKYATQFNMVEVEALGLLKMDFLGLRTLTDIQKALEIIEAVHKVKIDFEHMECIDTKTYELMSSGDTLGVFQLESSGMQSFMKDLKPNTIENVIAGVSLYRPGPMDFIPDYIKGKESPENVVYESEVLKNILEGTFGVIVYQEQVMQIVQDVAGFSLGEADIVRRIMSKKKLKEMEKYEDIFIYGREESKRGKHIDGAVARGYSESVAKDLFNKMKSFASYAFNKSHAACYAYLSYQTAYLKTHYPAEALTAILNNRIGKADEITKYVAHAKEKGIEILKPDINKSRTYFGVENGGIRFGLAALKGVGVAVTEEIIKERKENGDFKDTADFINRMCDSGVNKRCIEGMIYSGAFDDFGKTRSQLLAVYETLVERATCDKKNKASGQVSMFDTVLKNDTALTEVKYPNIPELEEHERLKKEKEVIGIYVSGHPLDDYVDLLKSFNLNSLKLKPEIGDEDAENGEEVKYSVTDGMQVTFGGIIAEKKRIFTKNGNKEMAFLQVEDLYGYIEIAIFPNQYAKLKKDIEEDVMAVFKGKISMRDGKSPSVILDNLELLEKDTDVKDSVKTKQETTKAQTLYLKYNVEDEKLNEKITNLLSSHIGQSNVIIKCESTGRAFKLNLGVNINSSLLMELHAFVKSDHIKVA